MLMNKLSDRAMEIMQSSGYTQLTLDSIYSYSFKPILDYYLTKGIENYDPELNGQIESIYLEQYQNGSISRQTYYKRLRGISVYVISPLGYFKPPRCAKYRVAYHPDMFSLHSSQFFRSCCDVFHKCGNSSHEILCFFHCHASGNQILCTMSNIWI